MIVRCQLYNSNALPARPFGDYPSESDMMIFYIRNLLELPPSVPLHIPVLKDTIWAAKNVYLIRILSENKIMEFTRKKLMK